MKPFHVRVNDMTVTVLGTHFNIMAYAGESQIETTLLEGSVQVNAKTTNTDPVQLYPGQQAILDKNNAGNNVAEVNTERAEERRVGKEWVRRGGSWWWSGT